MEKDLFIISREEIRRIAALAEMTQTEFFEGWITPASLTFIEQGDQEWSYKHVCGLLNKIRECRSRVKVPEPGKGESELLPVSCGAAVGRT